MARGQTIEDVLAALPPATKAERVRYWFDDDPTSLATLQQMQGELQIDASALIEGLHTLHLQIEDENGALCSPRSSVFLKFNSESNVAPAAQLRYWYDELPTVTTVAATSGLQTLDVSALVEGLHTLHYQVVDSNGKAGHVMSSVFLKINSKNMVTPAAQLRYWYDELPTVTTVAATSGLQTLDVSALVEGLHTLHYQVVDSNGKASHVMSSVFLKFNHLSAIGDVQAKNLLYWFDDAVENMASLPMSAGVQQIDASSLVEGLHTLHYQVVCNDGSLTSVYSSIFLKMDFDMGQAKAQRLRYWFDNLTSVQETDVLHGTQHIDASTLVEGLHTLHYQLVDETGAVCSPMSAVFLKMNVDASQSAAKTQRYWFDDDLSTLREQPVNNGTQMLEVDELLTGLHTLHYQLVDVNGKVTPPKSALFVKMPEKALAIGENAITDYMYWTNDYSQNNVKVKLTNPASPYHLLTLLPTMKAPIRSTSFKFELTDGQPTIYARNDIHVRFYDTAGYWADDARTFVDYGVSERIHGISELETTQTFERPAENGIKWFSFDAEYGDSIALKSNQPTSIQVFDAKGKEVYATSADKSVRFGGCHLLTSGTCYVAVHDVTGTGSNVTLNAQFIDKFAVFEYTPNRFASMGKTLMTFKGNGLEQVKRVELTDGETTFVADTIVASSANMIARFSLNEQIAASQLFTLNVYFHNTEKDESKTITYNNGVALEPANNVPLMAVQIVTERRVGDPYPIKVTLKNEGNVPQYGIPVNIAFDNVNMFDEFLFSDFELLLSKELHESRDFFTYTNNLLGTGRKGFFMPLFVPYMGPHETRTYTFGVRTNIAHARFNMYAWAGQPWTVPPTEGGRECPDSSNISDVYDMLDNVENLGELFDLPINPANVVRPFIGAGEAIAGIIQGSTRAREDAVFDAYGIDPSERDQYRFQFRYSVRSPRDIARDALNLPLPDLEDLAQYPCPYPEPHLVDVYIPGDPNEMTGYEAPSGSRYMRDDIVTVGYDIEFENDPEIANSAAHCIVIENQLDPTKFNLKSFTPKEITLSGKKVELDGSKSFVKTLDLRPEIDAIAELQCAYNVQTGLIRWTFTSLDPMTMEPTDDIMQGVLPVNHDGKSGIGNVTYMVDLLKSFPDGTQIPNKASIIFDTNEPIETPLWVNTIDAVCPEGRVTEAVLANDSTATICCEGSDTRSGVWKYEVYVQYGSGELWEKAGECPADSAEISFRVYDGMDYGFCALAVDSAGNVEVKEMAREASLGTYLNGDANADGTVDIEDVVNAMRYFLGKTDVIYLKAADITGDGQIDIEDVVGIGRIFLTQPSTAAKSPIKRQRLRESLQP